ncbi:hypothetical protein [uncultured Campylobacter sp.]|uniref:hypothetical protein n=1 Tax=uncultured Campylobacter sp. TaxID=218934 RepID=UPI0026219E8D|nr:hypothetical protein [uncultured Campylobacter sp.]
MSYYFSCIFHKRILAFFILVLLSGCGYKAPPFYSDADEQTANAEVSAADGNNTNDTKGGVRILRDK